MYIEKLIYTPGMDPVVLAKIEPYAHRVWAAQQELSDLKRDPYTHIIPQPTAPGATMGQSSMWAAWANRIFRRSFRSNSDPWAQLVHKAIMLVDDANLEHHRHGVSKKDTRAKQWDACRLLAAGTLRDCLNAFYNRP